MAKNYSKIKVLEAVENSAGVMEYVAVKLGCTWLTAKRYVDKWDETREAFDNAECKLHALAYQNFHKAVRNGERWAIERVLDTKARRNGHGIVDHKKIDLNASGEVDNKIEFVFHESEEEKAEKEKEQEEKPKENES